MILHGIAASEGIGVGRAVCVREPRLDYSAVKYGGVRWERKRLEDAVRRFNEDTAAMARRIRAQVGEKESEILLGQMAMLADPFLKDQMVEWIDAGRCAEAAVDQVCTQYAGLFSGADDELVRQRAADVEDIRRRMLAILLGIADADVGSLPAGTVLVVRDLTPSMAVGLDRAHVAAILTETGGRASHSAILARALELPAVLSVPQALERVSDGTSLIVDGGAGTVLTDPDRQTLDRYLAKQEEFHRRRSLLAVFRDRPTVDAVGNHYALYANIGSPAGAAEAAAAGAEGVGLFRTELLFMDRTALPTEEEQYQAYRSAARIMAGREVVIRTLDVGGDKAVGCLEMACEDNPFLGHRAIRYCLDNPGIYRTQLRALLRAGAEGSNIRILLPLVTALEEVRAARALLERCKAELEEEGLPFRRDMPLGVMVETPAAVLIADLLARECDFFSVGTNDLTQYTMAVDRGNAQVERLYTPFHPAVLRSVRTVISAARAAGIPVSMCGEAAADPRLIPLLMTWGLDGFSVSPSAVPATRAQIRRWRPEEAAGVTHRAMELSTAAEVEACLDQLVRP